MLIYISTKFTTSVMRKPNEILRESARRKYDRGLTCTELTKANIRDRDDSVAEEHSLACVRPNLKKKTDTITLRR